MTTLYCIGSAVMILGVVLLGTMICFLVAMDFIKTERAWERFDRLFCFMSYFVPAVIIFSLVLKLPWLLTHNTYPTPSWP